jgi:DHA2 family multidrug resistance protein
MSEEAQAWKPKYNPWLVAMTVTLATFMEVLDSSIANVALPHIAGSLGASQDESTWVLTSYLVSNAIILPASAWLATVMGRKRFYMLCVATFTVSSMLCGFALSLPMLIFFRILQGAGGGGMGPSEQAILADTFPPAKRGMGFAVYGMAVVVAPAIGPTLGGWITDNFDWRWIFFINIPIGLLSLFLTNRVVEDPPYMAGKGVGLRMDGVGLALLTVGIGLLQVVLDKGQQEDWFGSTYITVFFAVSMIMLVALVFWEWHHPEPVLELRLMKNRNFAFSIGFNFILGAVLYGTTVLVPQFLQIMMGYSAQQAGMALSPGGLAMMIAMPVAALLLKKMDPRWMISLGFLVTAAALYNMTHLSLGVDFWTVVRWRTYQSVGLAFIFLPISLLAYVGIPMSKNNQISSLSNFARNLGGGVGVSLLMTFLTRQTQIHQSNLAAHVTAGSPQFQQLVGGLGGYMATQGAGHAQATGAAYGTVMSMLMAQASTLAFVNAFWIVAVVVLCLVPLPFLLKRPAKDAKIPMG